MATKNSFPASADYPDLSKHSNWMAKCLTPEIYERLRDKKTPSGFTLDECIQTGETPPATFIASSALVSVAVFSLRSRFVERMRFRAIGYILASIQLIIGRD